MVKVFLLGVFTSLIASVIFSLFGRLNNNWFYLNISINKPKDKEKTKNQPKDEENKKKRIEVKLLRKFPWGLAYKKAKEAVKSMTSGDAKKLYDPTVIVGIGRGGAIYGGLLSYLLNERPILALERNYPYNEQNIRIGEDWYYPIEVPKELLQRVLLVAGEYHSGRTMSKFKERMYELGAQEVKTCVLYYQTNYSGGPEAPDYIGVSGKHDCLMPWQKGQFLRTWKSAQDAKKRKIKIPQMSSLKNGFFLMRHAQTDANVNEVFIGSGSKEEKINAEGRQEAMNVGKFLKETLGGLDVIFCSPMKRCLETAYVIVKQTGGTIIDKDELIEVDFGEWEGKQRSKIPQDQYNAYLTDQNYHIPKSKDSYKDSQQRANAFLDDLLQKHISPNKRILVITHKTIGRILVQSIEHKEQLHFRDIPMENASLRKIVVKDGVATIPYYIKVMDGDIVVV